MLVRFIATAALFALLLGSVMTSQAAPATNATTPSALRVTAERAYVYGFPMVDLYRIMFGYFIDPKTPAYKAPFNTLYNTANVYTPADTTVQTPNSDTPYSFVGFDLRAEPLVLTMPAIEKGRYYSAQFVDQYTFNIAYAGSRTTGNGGTKVLVAGPDWNGTAPAGIDKIVHFDTQFGLVIIRTQLFGASDLPAVKKIQAGYSVVPLSTYIHGPTPPVAPTVNWVAPLTPAEERTSPQFFDKLAFLLQFCPVDPSETEYCGPYEDLGRCLRASFEKIGIVPGKFDPGGMVGVYATSMAGGQEMIDAARAATANANNLFGTRAQMHNDYVERAVGAQYGILGNTAEEAIYLGWPKTADGKTPLGTTPATIHFAKGQLPPARAFWSVTMYNLPQQLLVANSIDRYLINSPMLPTLKQEADGGLTIYVQNTSPGAAREANWLPAPTGSYFLVLRIYWPEQSALSGDWKLPPLVNMP